MNDSNRWTASREDWLRHAARQSIRDGAACRCRRSDPPEMHDPRCDAAKRPSWDQPEPVAKGAEW
jgi:hypothetical protein